MNEPSTFSGHTPAVERITKRFRRLLSGDDQTDAGYLVLCVLAEESLGASCLTTLGASLEDLRCGRLGQKVAAAAADVTLPVSTDHALQPLPVWTTALLDRARAIARRSCEDDQVGSSHLVRAMVEVDGPVRQQLTSLGIDQQAVSGSLNVDPPTAAALPVDFHLGATTAESDSCEDASAADSVRCVAEGSVETLIDANLNRAREGLRVLEDFARFLLRSEPATATLKTIRHDLVSAERSLQRLGRPLHGARNVSADVGTTLSHQNEQNRDSLTDVVRANARRVQEALRSLEEFGKLLSAEFAARIKTLRYRSYQAEQLLLPSTPGPADPKATLIRQRLADARLYVLLTEALCRLPWQQAAERTLDGGTDILQLREKHLNDGALQKRAAWLQKLCEERQVLFVLNDRVDLAKLLQCDAVHLGQEDLADVSLQSRAAKPAIGLSTHTEAQLRTALPVADYVGVGPVFPSSTKSFDRFAGLDFVRTAAHLCPLPWFAIGGINAHNLPEVTDAGANAVAVSAAVIGTDSPQQAAANLRQQLIETRPPEHTSA